MTKLIDPIDSAGVRGARKLAIEEHKSMFSVEDYVRDYEFRGEGGDYKPTEGEQEMLVDAIHGALTQRLPQMTISTEMIEAGARAIAPEVWAIDTATFGHPDSLNRRGHELCKSRVRAQAAACIAAALGLPRSP
jgi:hypothetical protein